MHRFIAVLAAVGFWVWGTSIGWGQNYPTRPIRIVTGTTGSGVDLVARFIAQGLSGPLGQQVVVDNRSAGVIPGEIVSHAAPDGYNLLLFGGTLWQGQFFEKFPFDPLRDFAPITITDEQTNILVVHPSLPVKSVRELIDFAKAKPGVLNCSMGAQGGAAHLAAQLFFAQAGVNIVSIPFKGSGPAVTAVVSNEVQMMFSTAAGVDPFIKSGKLRALAVTSEKPSTLVPGLPTVAETVPGYVSVGNHALFAPAKTPPRIIRRLNMEVARLLAQPEMKKKFNDVGVEASSSTPEELTAHMKSEMAKLAKALKAAGVRPQ